MYRCVSEADNDVVGPSGETVHALSDGNEVLCHKPMSVDHPTGDDFARATHLHRCGICVAMTTAGPPV